MTRGWAALIASAGCVLPVVSAGAAAPVAVASSETRFGIDVFGDEIPETIVLVRHPQEWSVAIESAPPRSFASNALWSAGAHAASAAVVGPDVDGDGVRELFIPGHSAEGIAVLAAVDVVDAQVVAVLPRLSATGDLSDWIAADVDGNGIVDMPDLLNLLDGLGHRTTPHVDLETRIALVLDHWGAQAGDIAPSLGEAPLQCGDGPSCVPGPCPACIGGVCCRRPDGTVCGICLDGGGSHHGGGNQTQAKESPDGRGPGGENGGAGGAFGGLIPAATVPGDPPCPRVVRSRGGDQPDPATVAIGETIPLQLIDAGACPVRVQIAGPACFVSDSGACTGTVHHTGDGPLPAIRVTGCGSITIATDTACACDPAESPLVLQAYGIDLHVDSDNNDGRRPPRRTPEENAAEEAVPGKIIFVTNADRDRDGIPAWADGMDRIMHPAGTQEELFRVPLTLRLPDPSVKGWRVRFAYDASDPAAVETVPRASYEGAAAPAGTFRLWLDGSGDGTRPVLNHRSVRDGGDFVRPGQWIDGSRFARARSARLWLQAVNPTADLNDAASVHIDVEIEFLRAFPVVPGKAVDPTCRRDRVRVVAVGLTLHDLSDWGVALAGGDPFLVHSDLTQAPSSGGPLSGPVAGAIADATSICLVRATPALDLEALGVSLRVEFPNPGGFTASAELVGRLAPIASSTPGTLVLPRVPEPDPSATTARSAFGSGFALYVPPLGIAESAGLDAPGLILPCDAEGPSNPPGCAPLSFTVVGADGSPLGAADFRLRQPPLVLVHGIMSQAAAWLDSPMSRWDDRIVERTDWSTDQDVGRLDAHVGFEENLGQVSWSIERAIRRARAGAFPGAPPSVRYAATRADVVAHSQGGQIARWYAADFPDGMTLDRGGDWGSQTIRRFAGPPTINEGRVAFRRPDNWGAGPINRLITIGSPFRGTPLAAAAAGTFVPSPAALRNLVAWRNAAVGPMPHGLAAVLWPDGPDGLYVAPSCLSDLGTGSAAMVALRPDPAGSARYPSGHRSVQWVGVATRVTSSDLNATIPGLNLSVGRTMWLAKLVRTSGAVPPRLQSILSFVWHTLASEGEHDSAVPVASQLDERRSAPRFGNRILLDGIAHSRLLVPYELTQLGSTRVDAAVRSLLRAPRDGAFIDANQRDPDGRVRFGPLGASSES
ncbi:MAG: hypothetical protein AB8G96_00975 [Phycisphaerales bacterium]